MKYISAFFAAALLGSGTAWGGSLDHALGKALFDRLWTSAPASTDATDGLGPLFNARSCATCHPKGGRGSFEEDENGRISGTGLILRVGNHSGQGDPVYGKQLQTQAVQGLKAEGRLVRANTGDVRADGLTGGSPGEGTKMSGRLAPTLRGVGSLEAIPQDSVLAWADPEDANRDGISGRANYSHDAQGKTVFSRFGWKAGKASVRMQSAAALNADLGLSNPIFPHHQGDCTASQPECLTAPHGGSPHFENLEIDTRMLNLIASYVENLSSPPGVKDDKGQKLFIETGCGNCHRGEYTLANGDIIAPFTDLLLHDMGDALADGIGDALASGREWRTAPLWGLKNAKRFLHDGRARSVYEAIQYHQGEGEAARKAFSRLPKGDKKHLLAFLFNL